MSIDFTVYLIKTLYKNKFALNLTCLYFIEKLGLITSFHRKKYLCKSYYGSVSKFKTKINGFCNDRFSVTISFQLRENIISDILRLDLSLLKFTTHVMK